jgi:hypothetical protein
LRFAEAEKSEEVPEYLVVAGYAEAEKAAAEVAEGLVVARTGLTYG